MNEELIMQLSNFKINQGDLLIRMLLATGIGFSIGLEREYSTREDHGKQIAGIRTFIFIVLLGFVSALMALSWGSAIFVAAFSGVVIFVGISYWVNAHNGELGGTTEFTTLIAFLLGAMILVGYIEISLAATVVVLTLLSLKFRIREIMGKVTREELYAVIQFIVVLLMIFPFLPDHTIGPYQVFNPRELGNVIVIISGIGLGGYILSRAIGMEKGILVSGIVGGMVSSTMVSWIYSAKSRKHPAFTYECTVAILMASVIMAFRVFIWVWIFNSELIQMLLLPFSVMILAGIIVALIYYRKSVVHTDTTETAPLGKPLDWRQSLLFAVFYTGIMFVVSYAGENYGSGGVYLSSGIAALTDVDAITISVSKLAGHTITTATATNAILIVAICNTLVKWGISLWNGSRALRRQVSFGFGAMVLAGLVGIALKILFFN